MTTKFNTDHILYLLRSGILVIFLERFNESGGLSSNINGIEDATKTLPTDSSTMSGNALTKGCFSIGV
tara:strand:+ start:434 stop:637 length:204 start_codon:yes stop_codon:yes gene_type:complete